eukprot:29535-Pyramimonas_sp.AAC.1
MGIVGESVGFRHSGNPLGHHPSDASGNPSVFNWNLLRFLKINDAADNAYDEDDEGDASSLLRLLVLGEGWFLGHA